MPGELNSFCWSKNLISNVQTFNHTAYLRPRKTNSPDERIHSLPNLTQLRYRNTTSNLVDEKALAYWMDLSLNSTCFDKEKSGCWTIMIFQQLPFQDISLFTIDNSEDELFRKNPIQPLKGHWWALQSFCTNVQTILFLRRNRVWRG